MNSDEKSWIAYTDGASRGNPGPAGAGAFLISPRGEEVRLKSFLGEKTNNQAEYEALLLALGELSRQKAGAVVVRADSELMVRQMLGQYKVKNANMIPLFERAVSLTRGFASVRFEHVRREFNKEADKLANQAIDEAS